MFVPVRCTSCEKPFQVPEPALGKPAACPWCHAVVTALPVAAPVAPLPAPPEPRPKPAPSSPAPRWLKKYTAPKSDSQPHPAPAKAVPVARPEQPEPLSLDDDPPAPDPARTEFSRRTILLGVGAVLVVGGVTLGALQRKEGWLVRTEWRAFAPPDGSCSADLLGKPVEDPDAPASGRRMFVSEGFYSGARTWIGWKDLTTAEVQLARAPEGWRLLRLTIFDPERERLRAAFGGYVAKDATLSFEAPITVEFRLETPTGPLVARVIVRADGPRPRAYFVGLVGKRIAPDGPEANRLFDSLQVRE